MLPPNFTPGPWRRGRHRAIAAGTGGNTVTICEVLSGSSGIDQADANEALIIAAPELFTAGAMIYNLIGSGFLTAGTLSTDKDAHDADCRQAIDALRSALSNASTRFTP